MNIKYLDKLILKLKELGLYDLELFNYAKEIIEYKTLNKNEVFIEENKQNNKIGLLFNGTMLATYISEKGNIEVSKIYSFINGNTIVSNHESYFFNKYSTETIIAIEQSNLIVIKKDDLNNLLIKFPSLQKIVLELAEKSYIKAMKRIRELQSLTAKERIFNYYSKYPELFNIVNKKDLASYLNINRNDFTKFLKEIS